MSINSKNISLIFLLCLITCFIAACKPVGVIKGVPLKSYKVPPADLALIEQQTKKTNEEILKLTQTHQNAVFKETKGVSEYIIGPGDVLTLTYWMPYSPSLFTAGQQTQGSAEGFMQTTSTVTVRPDGKITYSFGDDIPVAGHTANEVREILIGRVKDYIKKPRLEVLVKEYKSKSALLFGRINSLQSPLGMTGPGKYPLKEKTSILDLIITAGGPVTGIPQRSQLRTDANYGGNGDLRKVDLVRKGKKYTLNLYSALFGGDMSNNVILDDGDMITVPEEPTYARRVYVFGQVYSPGVYSLVDANDLLMAISLTGGYTALAVQQDIKIVREFKERQGKPLVLSVNLDDILKRGDLSQNIALQDGDLVYVPRMLIGDINEFIANVNPLMTFFTSTVPPAQVMQYYMKDPSKLKF
ncbi:MAG: polysaccharide biosynthesis/export family protein [Syntrophales bacterium]